MNFYDYVEQSSLLEAIDAGLIDVRPHPSLPLDLYCYARKALYDWQWNDVTKRCRGIIVDRVTKRIIARPFEKFFDLDTEDQPETHLTALLSEARTSFVSEKIDGSLGTLWRYGSHWGVASKGSFVSDHAKWATKFLEHHIEQHGKLVFPEGFTPIFEMVCESVQTHIVSYGGTNDLYLIGLVSINTGEELGPTALQGYAQINKLKTPEFYKLGLYAASQLDRENKEGFVFTFPQDGKPPIKVKVKHKTFLRHQKLVHGINPKKLLMRLTSADDEAIKTLYQLLPPHAEQEVRRWERLYRAEYNKIRVACTTIMYDSLKKFSTRKEAAEHFNLPENKEYAAICFALLDQAEKYKELTWKLVEKRVKIKPTIDAGDE